MITATPQVARVDGEQKTDSANAGSPVAEVSWVDYDPIMRDLECERAKHAEKQRQYPGTGPMWTGD